MNTSLKSLFSQPSVRLNRFIEKERWGDLRVFLKTTDGEKALQNFKRDPQTKNTLLHYVCMHRPPLDVVRTVLGVDTSSLRMRNSWGQTPLHVASSTCASPKIVRFLLQLYPAVCLTDVKGRTPLMLAAGADNAEMSQMHFSLFLRKRNALILPSFELMDVIRLLANAAPTTVNVEDESGMSALEHSIVNGAHIEVVRLIMRRSREQLLREEAKGKARQHDPSRISMGSSGPTPSTKGARTA